MQKRYKNVSFKKKKFVKLFQSSFYITPYIYFFSCCKISPINLKTCISSQKKKEEEAKITAKIIIFEKIYSS